MKLIKSENFSVMTEPDKVKAQCVVTVEGRKMMYKEFLTVGCDSTGQHAITAIDIFNYARALKLLIELFEEAYEQSSEDVQKGLMRVLDEGGDDEYDFIQ